MWGSRPSPIKTFAVSRRQIPRCIQHESFLSIDLTPSSFAVRTVDLATRSVKRDEKLSIEIEIELERFGAVCVQRSHKSATKARKMEIRIKIKVEMESDGIQSPAATIWNTHGVFWMPMTFFAQHEIVP
jgi:fructose/tagatose bisphosphate aldolase